MTHKLTTSQLIKSQKGKYNFCDKSILTWLNYRIENYLKSNCKNKKI